MDPIFKKLNYKGQAEILAVDCPQSFEPHLKAVAKEGATIFEGVRKNSQITFAIAFATQQERVNELVHAIAPQLWEDAVFWFCYPKGSSKKYQCDFNRDTGWAVMGAYGLEGVRQVAIDEDWSALRFRKVNYIKKFTRNAKMVLSKAGRERLK